MQFCQKITKVIQKHWKWFKFCHSLIHNWNSVFLIKFSTSSYLWQIITNIPTWPKRLDTKHSYFKIKIYACHTSMFVMKEVSILSVKIKIYASHTSMFLMKEIVIVSAYSFTHLLIIHLHHLCKSANFNSVYY